MADDPYETFESVVANRRVVILTEDEAKQIEDLINRVEVTDSFVVLTEDEDKKIEEYFDRSLDEFISNNDETLRRLKD